MKWDEAIHNAKEELGITGYCDNFDEVVDLAKQMYWNGDSFKELKEQTIENAEGICELCTSENSLTAHHISYGGNEETICVCTNCHKKIHKIQKTYGFICQLCLMNLYDREKIYSINPHLVRHSSMCFAELDKREVWHDKNYPKDVKPNPIAKDNTWEKSNYTRLRTKKVKYAEIIKNKTLGDY